MLALSPSLGGTVRLEGVWPQTPAAQAGWELLRRFGCAPRSEKGETPVIELTQASPLAAAPAGLSLPEDFPDEWLPLPLALLAQAALRHGSAALPAELLDRGGEDFRTDMTSFCTALHLAVDNGVLRPQREEESAGTAVGRGWNAPTPVWALALALAACARDKRQVRLGNPGIITALYPAFWALYNGLPEPRMQRQAEKDAPAAPRRRRVITNAIAVLPEPRDEDY